MNYWTSFDWIIGWTWSFMFYRNLGNENN